jgi:hypothetical protein
MNRPVAAKIRHYTLVEIMVAMAILVIMMGFLFHFVIGAQRVWSATTRSSAVFDKAQIVLDVLENDLRNALVSDEPGREIPVYLRRELDSGPPYDDAPFGEHIKKLYVGVVTNTSSRGEEESATASLPIEGETYVGTYPVLYYFNREDYKIYRIAVDDDSFDNAEGNSKSVFPWHFFGADYTNLNFMQSLITSNDAEKNPFYYPKNKSVLDVIADNVLEVNVQFYPSSSGYVTTRPKVAKITLTLFDPMAIPNFANLPNGTATERETKEEKILEVSRVFTKLIFLQ